jgi:hypothetical protein
MSDDGSFTYMPTSDYAGGDSFTYRAGDPAGDYVIAQVNLTVAAPPSASISAPAVADTYVAGQSVPTAFSCNEGVGGTGLSSCTDSNGVKTGSGGFGHLDTSTVGPHEYTVTATSKDGLTGSASTGYTVVPKPESPKRPEDPPGPLPGIELSLSVEKKALHELLRTGKLAIAATVDKTAEVALTGGVKLDVRTNRTVRMQFVEVLKDKTISFSEPGRREETLTLSERGRKVLRRLSKARLTIVGKATDPSGEEARRTVVLTLRR